MTKLHFKKYFLRNMRVFLDTNIIIDFFAQREGHYQKAAVIMELAKQEEIEIVVSATTFVNAFFLLKGYFDAETLYKKMESLANKCIITPVDGDKVREALAMRAKDFEDSVQLLSANTIPADVIVTRDKHFKDYQEANIMSPTRFLETFYENKTQQ